MFKCKACNDTGYGRCVCQLDGFNEGGCEICHDNGNEICSECDAAILAIWKSEEQVERIAELENENKAIRESYAALERTVLFLEANLQDHRDLLGIDKTTADDLSDGLKSYTASIDSIKRVTMKKGQQMAILTLSLGVEIVVFPRTWDANKIVLSGLNETNRDATFHCSISNSDNRNTIVLNTVVIDEYTERKADNG